jgi:hypothetical protein
MSVSDPYGYIDGNGVWQPNEPRLVGGGAIPQQKQPQMQQPQAPTNLPLQALALKGLFGMFGGKEEATKEVAKQAAKEVVKDATPGVLESVGSNISSMGGYEQFAVPAAVALGTIKTGEGLRDLYKGKKSDPVTRGVTAMSTFGGSEIARALGFGSKGRDYAGEQKTRIQKLKDSGVQTHEDFDWYGDSSKWKKGEALPDIKNLKATNIWGLPAMYEKYGNDWLQKFSEEKRKQISQMALDAGAVINKDHQTDIDWNNEVLKKALEEQGVI